ncbi:uncharacterized protein LOC120077399 [Benincasa hispida]|uniref:uncharacterized protein LOC120077399 n=1 Tax=Benincasa hispida TaxID=102211 RepID=UPI00190219A2|nr:uncharacterized protein LOC120077399 [Benincasa hispida]
MDRPNENTRAYILASLNDVLAKKREPMVTTCEIMKSLSRMFRQPFAQLKHDTLKFIFNSKMKEGTFVHVLHMMVHFNVAEMDGSRIDVVSQVSIILETLPKIFLHFVSNAFLNRVDYTLTVGVCTLKSRVQ